MMNWRIGRYDDCDFVKADFMNIFKSDNIYDGVY